MRGMKKNARHALIFAAAIAGGLAAPMRSDASVRKGLTPPPRSSVTLSAASYAPRSALSEPARAEIRGRVVRVADGDTLTILDAANAQHKIRLYGIDAPEKSQAFGQKSKQHLSSLVFGKDISVKVHNTDRYGRTVGTVFIDGRDVNLEMLKAGLAWHYKYYDSTPAYAAAESAARAAKLGLWQDKNPINPYEFRKGNTRAQPEEVGSVTNGDTHEEGFFSGRVEYRAGNAMPVGSRTPAPVCDTWPDTGYWLSTNSNKRHNRNCENYRKTRGYPCSKTDGVPCGKCGG